MTDNHLTMSESVPRVPEHSLQVRAAQIPYWYYTEGIKAQSGRFRLPTRLGYIYFYQRINQKQKERKNGTVVQG